MTDGEAEHIGRSNVRLGPGAEDVMVGSENED